MNKTAGRAAFTLIELLVYTVLFSFFSLVAFGFCNGVYLFLSTSCSQSARAVKNSLALDMIRRDLMSASKDPVLWDEVKCVFCFQQIDVAGNAVTSCVGWEACMNKRKKIELRRSEGVYNFSGKKWESRSTSNFASGITALRVTLIPPSDQAGVARVRIIYVSQGKEFEEIIVLRNRVVL